MNVGKLTVSKWEVVRDSLAPKGLPMTPEQIEI